MNQFTVILYGTDSDGDPDVFPVHVTTSETSAKGIINEARIMAAKELGDDCEEGEFNLETWGRFEGDYPIIFVGHLKEAVCVSLTK